MASSPIGSASSAVGSSNLGSRSTTGAPEAPKQEGAQKPLHGGGHHGGGHKTGGADDDDPNVLLRQRIENPTLD